MATFLASFMWVAGTGLRNCSGIHAVLFYETHFAMKTLMRREIKETNAEIAYVGYDAEGMKLELTHWRAWGPAD